MRSDMNFIFLYPLFFLFMISTPSNAALKAFIFEDIIKNSDFVAHISVKSGEILFSKNTQCGYIYTAEIIDDFDSSLKRKIDFFSSESMSIDVEYLIFLTKKKYPKPEKQFNDGNTWFESCAPVIPKIRAYGDHGFLFKFTNPYQNQLEGKWLIHEKTNVYFREPINLVSDKHQFTFDLSSEINLENRIFYNKEQNLLKWTDVKKIIQHQKSTKDRQN